jgi:glycosyltransferase involved in cell wall biosynthesis
MINHTQWSRNLGAPRVQLELAEEFRKMGHVVDKFSYEDAFPYKQSKFEQLTCDFSQKARAFIQKNGREYDVIEANQKDLPFSKKELRINGLLVVRSVGLIPLYQQFFEYEKVKWPEKTKQNWKSLAVKLISYPSVQRMYARVVPSMQVCDLINVANRDELAYVSETLGLGEKCVWFPFGLSKQRQLALESAVQPANIRLRNKEVAFIGVWNTRKGSKDWPEIIKRVRSQVPDVQFLFLGTSFSREYVLKDLNLLDNKGIKIIPNFDSDELPKLLSGATVGAFPSYIEGFGFAVLEKLACGLPTVTYDVPGPREMMHHLDHGWMVPAGNVAQLSERLVKWLSSSQEEYICASRRCIEVAKMFDWSEIAASTIAAYSEWLERIK